MRAIRCAACVVLILAPSTLGAQVAGPSVSTESGVYTEGYSMSGRPSLRPSGTVRFYASPTFTWMGFTIGTNLLWSTEQHFVAQSMDRYYINPRWSWGQIHAGDYVPSLSRYTASAVTIRGGGLDLSPGPFRISAAYGRAQRASDLSVFDAAPQRTIYAGLIGVGSPDRTFFQISALRAIDDATGTDTLSVAPQENMVAAVEGGLRIFGGRVTLKSSGSASLYSRDIRAGALDSLNVPSWTGSLFTPRVSSRIDYAWNAELRVSGRPGSLGATVEYVGPGFVTLGNPYMANDKQEIRGFGTLRLIRGRVITTGSFGVRRDNLAGDKVGTTFRRTGSLGITAIAGRWSVTSVTVLVNGMTRNPTPAPPTAPTPLITDSLVLKNVAFSLSAIEQVRFGRAGLSHQITLSVAEQRISDGSPRYDTLLDAQSRTVGLDYGLTFDNAYTISVRPSYQQFVGANVDESYWSMGLGLARRPMRGSLALAVNAAYTGVAGGWQLRTDGTGSLRLTRRDNLTVQLRYTTLRGTTNPYDEVLASMRVTHRW